MKGIRTTAIAMLFASFAASAQQPSIPERFEPQIRRAERLGEQIFRAHESQGSLTPAQQEAVATAQAATVTRCDGPYRPVVIADPAAPGITVYLIYSPPVSKGLAAGVHYRFDLSPDGKKVVAATPSNNDCMFIPYPPAESLKGKQITAAYVSHLLSTVPTEFHVFLSFLHRKQVYVTTSAGIWRTDGHRISLVKAY